MLFIDARLSSHGQQDQTGLIAYRKVLRKAGFNYSKCCSSPMAEATSIEFSHIIQLYLTFKTKQTRNKFPANLDSFFTEVGSQMVVSWRAQQWERGGGPNGGQGVYEKCQRKVNK